MAKKKRKVRPPREFWVIKPITRIKDDATKYDRKKEKLQIDKEEW